MIKERMPVISGVILVVVLLVRLFSFTLPAAAGTLEWSAESIPSTTGNVLGPAGIDVRDIAVAADGTTIYAMPGDSVSDNVVYESTDAGVSWTTLDVSIAADLVAVAPDDADVVAIASENTSVVYITTNGGSTWSSLGVPQENGGAVAAAIYNIAISPATDGIHYVAVAGKEAGDIANVWYFNVGSVVPVWKETNILAGFSSANVMKAVAFSPNFTSDKVMAAIGESDNVSVSFQVLSLSSNNWNTSAGFVNYPVTIVSDDGITGLSSASISLEPEYLGGEDTKRTAFIGLTIDGDTVAIANSGVFRLQNTSLKVLKGEVNIHSIAFNGSRLVAGGYDTNIVYRSANPLATTPTVDTVASLKRPGGENRVLVAWAGGNVVAGTSGNESAFAVSMNYGSTFNDISLIDTSLTNVRDVSISTRGNKVYLVTDDGTDLSLWRQDSSWERVLSKQGATNYLVRIAPESPNAIYLAEKGGKTIYYSEDAVQKRWFTRTCVVNIQDLAVETADIAYVLSSEGKVTKSVNTGSVWSAVQPTGLNSGATIVSVSQNNLLVGSQDGYVASTTDGNTSWTKISKIVQDGAGNIQVVADKDFISNKIIYAASDTVGQDIKKWAIGSSTAWSDIFQDVVPGGVYGINTEGGTLYALEFNPATNQSTLWQCPSPTTATDSSESWNSVTTTNTTDVVDSEVFLNASPRALKTSSGGKLWAVKTNGTNRLYSFTNTLAELIFTGPSLRAPAQAFAQPANPKTGIAYDIVFSWSSQPMVTEYKLYIAYDEDFNSLVTTVTKGSDQPVIVAQVGTHQTGDNKVNFSAGTTYYWRVRITKPLFSPYSETRSFNIEPLPTPFPHLLTPANGGTGISRTPAFSWNPLAGVTQYRFVLSDNVTLASPIVDAMVEVTAYAIAQELDYGKIYFWAVKPIAPTEGNWSAIANFTVKEKPVTPMPSLPLVVVQRVPPPVIELPLLPQTAKIVVSPPPTPPTPIIPAYIWAAIVIESVLIAVVIYLIVRTYR